MNKTASLIITVALIVGIGIVLVGRPGDGLGSRSVDQVQNVEVRDGVQYITIDAGGGYFPRVSTAQSNIPTKLIVKTSGVYDCSASLVIKSIGYQKILAQTGEEVIDLGIPGSSSSIQGTCGMGMYGFKLNFI